MTENDDIVTGLGSGVITLDSEILVELVPTYMVTTGIGMGFHLASQSIGGWIYTLLSTRQLKLKHLHSDNEHD